MAGAVAGKDASKESSALCGDPHGRPLSSRPIRPGAGATLALVAPPESLQELGERAGGAGHMLWFGEQAEEHEHGLALEAADTGPASPAPPHLSRKSSPHRRQTHAQTAPPALSQTFL